MQLRPWLAAALLALGCAGLRPQDPVATDPRGRDAAHPAALAPVALESGGERLHGIVYVAAGPGPHPTLVLLHGFPGNERNLDLAQAVRRAGWNVLFFHYRGAWGSGGDFSFANAHADVAAAVGLVTSPAFASRFRADPRRIALVGHSMGGFLALLSASELDAVGCVGSIAGANLGRLPGTDPGAVARRLDAIRGPLRTSGASLVAELVAAPERFDLLGRARALAFRPVLLVAGSHDEVAPPALHHEPLVDALLDAGPLSLRALTLPADHAFSTRRIALARAVIGWLEEDCAGASGG